MSFPVVINASYSQREHTANTADRYHTLGQRMEYDDGRKFRYVLAGGVTLVVADLIQGVVVVAADSNLAVQANWAIGDTSGTVTAQGSAAIDFYKGGWTGITNTPGIGYAYKVLSHPLFAGATKTITLFADDPIRVALTTSSEVSFIPDPYNGVLQAKTTITNKIVGAAQTPITNAQYGWVQTGGVAMVHGAGSEVVGNNLIALAASAGRGGVAVSPGLLEYIGIALMVVDDAGDPGLVDLRID